VQELSYDALIQFASTSRVFYVQIAKMIHNPSRRREEAPATPPPAMQTAAAVVSLTMRDALTSVHELVRVFCPNSIYGSVVLSEGCELNRGIMFFQIALLSSSAKPRSW